MRQKATDSVRFRVYVGHTVRRISGASIRYRYSSRCPIRSSFSIVTPFSVRLTGNRVVTSAEAYEISDNIAVRLMVGQSLPERDDRQASYGACSLPRQTSRGSEYLAKGYSLLDRTLTLSAYERQMARMRRGGTHCRRHQQACTRDTKRRSGSRGTGSTTRTTMTATAG